MISVIIPIYNTEKFLSKCLNSVKNQTFKDFEVIMVDDGSTDNSADICQRFEKEDSRFMYYYKENGGSGSARNMGLDKAQGDYIAFVDSDDFVEPDYLETLENQCSGNYDIIQGGMTLIRNGEKILLAPGFGECSDHEYVELVIKRKLHIFLFQSSVAKLYKKRFIKDNDIRFDESITVSEDCLFNTQLLPCVESIKLIEKASYNYLQDNSTLSRSKKTIEILEGSILVGIKTADIRFKTIMQYNLSNDSEIQKGFQTAICIIYISNAREIETGEFTKEEKKKLYDSYFSVMNYPIDLAVNSFEGTDKRIALASAQKDRKTISSIFRCRRIKKWIIGIFGR